MLSARSGTCAVDKARYRRVVLTTATVSRFTLPVAPNVQTYTLVINYGILCCAYRVLAREHNNSTGFGKGREGTRPHIHARARCCHWVRERSR